jgi:hypothetical protein
MTSVALAVTICLAFSMPVFAVSAVEGFSLRKNGENVSYNNHTHIVSDGDTLLPLRYLAEAFGASVSFDYQNNIIQLGIGGNNVEFALDSAVVRGSDGAETPVVNVGGRTHVPVSFIEGLWDVTVHLDQEGGTLLVSDNAVLDIIFKLMGQSDMDDVPTMFAEFNMDSVMTVTVTGGDTEVVESQIEGFMRIDYLNRFQHIFMATRMMGMEMVSEIYDDGEAMYVVAEGAVMRLPTSGFALSDDLMAQFQPMAGMDFAREHFAGLKLVQTADTYVISGEMTVPDSLMADAMNMVDLNAFLPAGMDDMLGEMNMRFTAPIAFSAVFDRDSLLMTAMEMAYAMDMVMTIMGETVSNSMAFVISLPTIEYNVEMDIVVPVSILEAAVDMF